MKPEIKAMLPEFPTVCSAGGFEPKTQVIEFSDFDTWLDKLTEGASVVEGQIAADGSFYQGEPGAQANTHKVLAIPLGEIKKQTPLEIAVEAMKLAIRQSDLRDSDDILEEALAKIEAAK